MCVCRLVVCKVQRMLPAYVVDSTYVHIAPVMNPDLIDVQYIAWGWVWVWDKVEKDSKGST